MLVFAHRGASAKAPENTLLAIDHALKAGADGIEIDVHSVGSELYVIHDRYLHRTTNGQGLISQQRPEYIASLDAGAGQCVPDLWQVLQKVQGRCLVNIELKGVTEVKTLLAMLDKAVMELGFSWQQLLLSSFDHHLLSAVKQLKPQIKTGALTASKPVNYAAFADDLAAFSVNLDINCIDSAFVLDAKRRGLKVYVYTVDIAEDIQQMLEWQVDGIFSNDPAAVIQLIQSLK